MEPLNNSMPAVNEDLPLWKVVHRLEPGDLPANIKTMLFSGNGYLGIQASTPVGGPPSGTFINGFFEEAPIAYGEKAYGYPSRQQIMIPLADVSGWELREVGPDRTSSKLNFNEGIIEVDMLRGIRTLTARFNGDDGRSVLCRTETMASLSNPHRLYIRMILEGRGKYRLIQKISPPSHPDEETSDPRKMENLDENPFGKSRLTDGKRTFLIEETTRESGLSYCCAGCIESENHDDKLGEWKVSGEKNSFLSTSHIFNLSENDSVSLTMFCVFMTSIEEDAERLSFRGEEELKLAVEEGWDRAADKQRATLAGIWNYGDIRFGEKPEFTRAMRFGTYGLIQSTGTDRRRSASAKGLSSAGYNGHYFWDADIYVQGALNCIDPDRARTLVEYRVDTLDAAVERAKELSEAGALYPWRTINGRESSAFFPAGTAQFHINADVIWGLKEYIRNTGDTSILLEGGARMLFETARFWAAFAVQVPEKGYCFHAVTGPDEYTALVNNNFYTNLMASVNLDYAHSTAMELLERNPVEIKKLFKDLDLSNEEIDRWKEIGDNIYLPKLKGSDIFMQDDSFIEKSPWDWDATPREKRPLLLHYHPLKIYRHRVLKQPDVIIGLLLERHLFSTEVLRANFDYYDPLTSGDSSLSSAVQAAAAALAGREKHAVDHFRKTLFLDLEDIEENTENGIHLASMAGARLAFLYGFGGYRVTPEGPALYPRFPESWGEISFSLLYQGISLNCKVDPVKQTMQVEASSSLDILINNERIELKDHPVTVLIS